MHGGLGGVVKEPKKDDGQRMSRLILYRHQPQGSLDILQWGPNRVSTALQIHV
jgi:hypothetical protein